MTFAQTQSFIYYLHHYFGINTETICIDARLKIYFLLISSSLMNFSTVSLIDELQIAMKYSQTYSRKKKTA